MKERPIIFNAEMVNAILSGRKTQTRRVIQSPAKSMQANGMQVIEYREAGDKWYGDHVFSMRGSSGTWHDYTKEQFLAKCPFGEIGDRLWVRETWARYNIDQYSHDMAYRATTPDDWPKGGLWRQSNHMPRWASRITLEITGVRVERLNSISDADVKVEGYPAEREAGGGRYDAWLWYRSLWESIYGEESWQANPWVWVIEFKRVDNEA
ncbi:MAG: hypothetical protein WCB03_12595 [Rouxiella badensis]|uniref:hypothetical protein n=1 Tax=Rouxiella badensis TaxID=1646377 RepID=UPI003C636E67